MVHVPTPQIQEHIGESIQVEEHIVDIPVPTIVEGSSPSVDDSASPVYNQVQQGQIAAEQESFERVQQHTAEQIIHVPILQIQEQIVEGVKSPLRNVFLSRLWSKSWIFCGRDNGSTWCSLCNTSSSYRACGAYICD